MTSSTQSSWYLLYPSSSSPSSDVGTLYASCTHIVWVTVAGLLGLRVCTNAIRFYYFCIDWNLITQKEWADLAAMHFFKQNYVSRKMQIQDVLITTTFGACRRTGQQGESNKGELHDTMNKTTPATTQDECTTYASDSIKQVHCEVSSCPICLGEFQDQEKVCQSKDAPSCSHVFHYKCLQAWLLKHTSCPVCRHEMVPPSTLPPSLEVRLPTLSVSPRQ
jgi:Ring finger domain